MVFFNLQKSRHSLTFSPPKLLKFQIAHPERLAPLPVTIISENTPLYPPILGLILEASAEITTFYRSVTFANAILKAQGGGMFSTSAFSFLVEQLRVLNSI